MEPRDDIRKFQERMLAELETDPELDEYSVRVGQSYLIGVYLAINAISDVRLVVEGPDCTYMKSQYIQGNHDLLSTLTSVSGFHRIVNTALHPVMMTQSRESGLQELMTRVTRHPSTAATLVTSMPMAFVTGADYERLCRSVAEETGKELIHVRGLSLQGDWLDGYDETLKALAQQMELPAGEGRDPRKVAIVGHLFDRNEQDHVANLAELKEMVAAASGELVSVWLSGSGFQSLKKVGQAGTILSLPYARRAARILARKTGATVLEMPQPFGLEACEHWMTRLGEHLNQQESAARYVREKLSFVIPKLEWMIPFQTQGMQCGYIGDPYLLPGMVDIFQTLGGKLQFGMICNRKCDQKTLSQQASGAALSFYPRYREFIRFMTRSLLDQRLDLLVTNGLGMGVTPDGPASVEFGFPSLYTHQLYPRPFLGFGGFLAFADTLVNALRKNEVDLTRRKWMDAMLGRSARTGETPEK